MASTFEQCITACDAWNNLDGLGTCVMALWVAPLNGCHLKSTLGSVRTATPGYDMARLIYPGYPTPTDLG